MVDLYGLFRESIEQHTTGARCTSVEPERELVEIVREVFPADSALEGAQQPPLQKGSHAVDGWHQDVSWVRRSREYGHLMLEPAGAKTRIGRPAVRLDDGSGFYGLRDEAQKTSGRDVGHVPQSNTSEAVVLDFHGDGDNGLLDRLAAADASFLPSHVALVHLDTATKLVPTWTHHCSSNLVEPRPGGLVAAQAEHTLEPKRVGPILLARQFPHRQEPKAQRLSSALEDGAGCQPRLGAAVATQQDIPPRTPWLTAPTTRAADKSVSPPQALQVAPTALLGRKELVELDEVPRVVHAWMGYEAADVGHAPLYHHRWCEADTPLPVISTGTDVTTWYAFGTAEPMVIYENGVYKMWYLGFSVELSSGATFYYRMGYATSIDGSNWQQHSGNPILDYATVSSGTLVQSAFSVVNNGKFYEFWHMSPGSPDVYATSPDGTNQWQASSTTLLSTVVSTSTPQNYDHSPSVLLEDSGVYKMWYTPVYVDTSTVRVEIAYATGVPSSGPLLAPSQGGTIVLSPPTGEMKVEIPPGAFGESVRVEVQPLYRLAPPVSSAANLLATGIGMKVTLDPPLQPQRSAVISISYRDADVVSLDERRLVIARYEEVARVWVPLVSTPDPANNRVVALTNHFSTFQVMQASPASALDSVTVFPNPLRPALGHSVMTFSQLPAEARIRIYTLVGEKVKDLTANASGMASWDGTNQSGAKVASGVYFVLAQGVGQDRTFKVAIQR